MQLCNLPIGPMLKIIPLIKMQRKRIFFLLVHEKYVNFVPLMMVEMGNQQKGNLWWWLVLYKNSPPPPARMY